LDFLAWFVSLFSAVAVYAEPFAFKKPILADFNTTPFAVDELLL
jgi:hypothetical protein